MQLKQAASRLKEAVATDIYNSFAYENPGLRPREILGKTYPEIADVLFSRLGGSTRVLTKGLTCGRFARQSMNHAGASTVLISQGRNLSPTDSACRSHARKAS